MRLVGIDSIRYLLHCSIHAVAEMTSITEIANICGHFLITDMCADKESVAIYAIANLNSVGSDRLLHCRQKYIHWHWRIARDKLIWGNVQVVTVDALLPI